MEQELALGQREITPGVQEPFSSEELDLVAQNGSSVMEIEEFVRTSGKQTINAALSGIAGSKAGKGQERNEPFQSQEEADAQVSGLPPTEQAAS